VTHTGHLAVTPDPCPLRSAVAQRRDKPGVEQQGTPPARRQNPRIRNCHRQFARSAHTPTRTLTPNGAIGEDRHAMGKKL